MIFIKTDEGEEEGCGSTRAAVQSSSSESELTAGDAPRERRTGEYYSEEEGDLMDLT